MRSAEVSHGTFYLYFTNEEELVSALARAQAEEVGTLVTGSEPVQDKQGQACRTAPEGCL